MNKTMLVAVALSLATLPAFAQVDPEHPVLRVAVDPTYPPMESMDDSGDLVGFDIELMKMVAAEGEFSFDFVTSGFDQIFSGLENGLFDAAISSITITDTREQSLDFSRPYFWADMALLVRVESPDIENASDLAELKVGVLEGSSGAKLLPMVNPSVDLVPSAVSLGEAPYHLASGGLDAILYDRVGAERAATSEDPLLAGKLKVATYAPVAEPYGIAVPKGRDDVLGPIERSLGVVLGSDQYQELVRKWFP